MKFSKTIEITEDQWDRLENQNNDGMLARAHISELDSYVDFKDDMLDADDYEDIEIVEVDDEGYPLVGGHELCFIWRWP